MSYTLPTQADYERLQAKHRAERLESSERELERLIESKDIERIGINLLADWKVFDPGFMIDLEKKGFNII